MEATPGGWMRVLKLAEKRAYLISADLKVIFHTYVEFRMHLSRCNFYRSSMIPF